MTREHCPGSKIEGLTVPSEVGLGEGQPPWETVWWFFKKWHEEGGPWVAQLVKRLTCAPVMSSQFPVRALRGALRCQLGAWSLLRIPCLPRSLPLPRSCPVSLPQKN